MTSSRNPDVLIAAFLDEGISELPDRTFDAVRHDIHRTRQRLVIGPWSESGVVTLGRLALAAAVVIAVGLVFLPVRPAVGPGRPPSPSPSPSPSPTVQATTSASATPATPTVFTSPMYGYTVTVPAGWVTAPAVLPWDGTKQPGPDAEADKFDGPDQIMLWAFAGPFDGTLAEFVQDRITANYRDHADTCPREAPDINEPVSIAGQSGTLLGWNCGAVINIALAVRAGVGYSFVFRDLAVPAASDPADSALFQSILDSVVFPT